MKGPAHVHALECLIPRGSTVWGRSWNLKEVDLARERSLTMKEGLYIDLVPTLVPLSTPIVLSVCDEPQGFIPKQAEHQCTFY